MLPLSIFGQGEVHMMISLYVGEIFDYLYSNIYQVKETSSIFIPFVMCAYLYINGVSSGYCLWYFHASVSQREKLKVSETCIYIRVSLI